MFIVFQVVWMTAWVVALAALVWMSLSLGRIAKQLARIADRLERQ